MDVRVDAAGGHDEAFAGDGFGRDADDHPWRDSGHDVGIAGLADRRDAPVLDADVGFVDGGPVDDERIGDHAVEGLVLADAGGLAHPIPQHFAAAELALVAVGRVIALDLGDEIGIAEAHAVSGCRAEQRRVVPAIDGVAHGRGSNSRAKLLPPTITRRPAIATSATVFVSPGSNRTAVPAGMSRRFPYAAARSNFSAGLVSTKW